MLCVWDVGVVGGCEGVVEDCGDWDCVVVGYCWFDVCVYCEWCVFDYVIVWYCD